MKKIFLILFAAFAIVLASQNQANPLTNDLDAQAFIDSIGDCPVYFQDAINNRVLAFKANGTWDSLKQCLLFPVTQNKYKCLTDLKTKTRTASFNDQAIASPYYTDNALGVNDGIFFTTNTGTGFIKTGCIPSSKMKLNNSAIAIIMVKDKTTGNANNNFGAYQSATQDVTINVKNSANACFADMYSNTNGRISHASASGAKGVYIANRVSSTKMKLMINGVIDSISTGQGSLPTIEFYLNCLNQSGIAQGRLNKPIGAFCVYGQSLTDAQLAQENTDWQQFISDAQRHGSYTKAVVFDGNSHMVSQWSRLFRQLQYDHAGTNDSTDYYNVATSGIATTTMITRAAAVADVLYNSSYSKNILVYWECTNDILAGKTATQTYNNAVTYCQARQSVGWKVIIIPPMSRGFSGSQQKMLCTDSVVTLLKANWSSFADKYCDYPNGNYFTPRSAYASDAAFKTGTTNLVSNTTYFNSDKTHLTEVADIEWAAKIRLEIDSL